jgi:hypothetical protein
MRRLQFSARTTALLIVALAAWPTHASFHLWTIAEVYSNASGDVQFIELVSSGSFETASNGAQIRTDSGNTFTITANLTGDTFNDRLLFATAGFYSLPGAPAVSSTQPTYTIVPTLPNTTFFNPASDRIRLFSPIFGEFHSRTINAGAPIPTDNVLSRVYSGATSSIVGNSPQARDVAAGSINRGDYNANGAVDAGDYIAWRKTLTQAASPPGSGADGNDSGTIDQGDHTVWKSRFGNAIDAGSGAGQSASVPEPSTLALIATYLVVVAWARRHRIDR